MFPIVISVLKVEETGWVGRGERYVPEATSSLMVCSLVCVCVCVCDANDD